MKQKGGSVASDAVTSLMSPHAYNTMNSNFTNQYSNARSQAGGNCNSTCPTCGGSNKHKNKNKSKKGGSMNMMDTITQGMKSNFVNSAPFVSAPAPAFNSASLRNSMHTNTSPKSITLLSHEEMMGGKKKVEKVKSKSKSKSKTQKGGEAEVVSLSTLMSTNSGLDYKIDNKKGGASDAAQTIGLNYNNILNQSMPTGDPINMASSIQNVGNRIMSTETVSSLPLINKITSFGMPPNSNQPFNYSSSNQSGGKGKDKSIFTFLKEKLIKAKLIKDKSVTVKSKAKSVKSKAKSVKSKSVKSKSVKA